jgi:hypothetical protein
MKVVSLFLILNVALLSIKGVSIFAQTSFKNDTTIISSYRKSIDKYKRFYKWDSMLYLNKKMFALAKKHNLEEYYSYYYCNLGIIYKNKYLDLSAAEEYL